MHSEEDPLILASTMLKKFSSWKVRQHWAATHWRIFNGRILFILVPEVLNWIEWVGENSKIAGDYFRLFILDEVGKKNPEVDCRELFGLHS
jgi:hypothetical protein